MPKKRSYTKVDVKKLSPSEKKAHAKRLAYVRKYTRDRREWERKIKSGELDKGFTLDQYRGAKHGHKTATIVQEAVSQIKGESGLQGILKRLVAEITREERKRIALEMYDSLKKFGE